MIKLFTVAMSPEASAAVSNTLNSGQIAEGPRVQEFEKRLSTFLGEEYVVTVNSGTTALQLALELAGARPGTSVVSTPMTCAATNLAALHSGAEIIWADIDPRTGLINPHANRGMIRGDTVAVVGVDWAGTPCDVAALGRMVSPSGRRISVIVDAAHSIGARYNSRPDYICHSFQAIKHLTTGDGGAVVCHSEGDYRRARLLRWFGIDREETRSDFRIEADIATPGYKWHMNDIAATIGIANLKMLGQVLDRHRINAAFYDTNLPSFYQPAHKGRSDSSYWLYTVLLPEWGMRHEFMSFMSKRGIETSAVHARNDSHSCFGPRSDVELVGVNEFASRQVNIPVHSAIGAEERSQILDAMFDYAWPRR